MSRFLPKPPGLWRIDRAFPKGFANRADNLVTVDLTGCTEWAGPWIAADPGQDYDWSRLRSFYVVVAVRKGIDATRTVKALMPIAAPFVMLFDVDSGHGASVLQLVPKLKLWSHSPKALEALAAWARLEVA